MIDVKGFENRISMYESYIELVKQWDRTMPKEIKMMVDGETVILTLTGILDSMLKDCRVSYKSLEVAGQMLAESKE
jgi:hypothetical protein